MNDVFLEISPPYEQELHSTILLKSQFHQMSQYVTIVL